MKASKFNVLITPAEDPSRSILYNTFHDHRIILENAGFNPAEFFRKIDSHEPLSSQELEAAETFKELGILLEDDADERRIFDQWYEDKIQDTKGSLHVLLTISMACNLRCPYCFEKDQLDAGRQMSLEQADQFIFWVARKIRENNLKHVSIIFFGGEPLMNQKVLYHVSANVQKLCEREGIRYEGAMISNGVLMKKEVAVRLRQCGIKWVKITLDGEKHTHDTSRITANAKGTFDQIIRNLSVANTDLADGEDPLYFRIGGNFSDHTYGGFEALLQRLESAPYRKYIQQINLKPVQEVSLTEGEARDGHSCHTSCFSEKNTERIMKLRSSMHEKQLPAIDGLNLGPCDFYRGDSVSIGVDGSIYPCSAFLDNEKYAIGNISDAAPSPAHAQNQGQWTQVKPWTPECYDCSFLPVCTGGCRATAYSNGYSWNATVCEKTYFNRIASSMAEEMLGIKASGFSASADPPASDLLSSFTV